jgi:hypothetical protein
MTRRRPVVHVVTQGNVANRMIQYLVARRIASLVPGCVISNVELPEWGVRHAELTGAGRTVRVEGHRVEVEGLAAALRSGAAERVELAAYGQWLANFPDRGECVVVFPPDPEVAGWGEGRLVCNIRGAEVLDARHPDYTLLPVFMGQVEDNAYCDELRAMFPEAEFRASQGMWRDFNAFRNSVNLVPAVSTFSWLAAWLSGARRIVLPVSGLFHPVQNRDADLLPVGDKRYSFVLFPINYAVPVGRHAEAHGALAGLWRQMRPEAIAALRAGPRWPRPAASALALLDEGFYLETYPDVAAAVEAGHMTALEHFRDHGMAEGRRPFFLDRGWYSRTYPMAALEVGQGDYADLEHHYVEIGRLRGYRVRPDSGGG